MTRENVERLHAILGDPDHPLQSANAAYQEFGTILQESRAQKDTNLVQAVHQAIHRYTQEKQQLLDQGISFSFLKLPEPWVGYLELNPALASRS